MQLFLKLAIAGLAFSLFGGSATAQTPENCLRRISDTTSGESGYVNAKGDTVIPLGKYLMCFTDRFCMFAIVGSSDRGLIGIDRNEHVLFNVFVFDNGPDYPSDGLFRIVKDGKIGYADLEGHIVIPPRFDCAYPFRRGRAKAGTGCKEQTDGEHRWWTEGTWYTIDKKGKVIRANGGR